jgi:hypothetical protein
MSATDRMLSLLAMCVLGGCVFVSTPLAAQEASSKQPASLVLPSGEIPTEIFGAECKVEAGDANFVPSLVCKSASPLRGPAISVSVRDATCDQSQGQMMERWRSRMNDGTPFFNVVWERPFRPAAIASAVGFSGFYQRSMGNRYVWATCGAGKLTEVLVIMFAPLDNDTLKAEVELKVFGVGAERRGEVLP